MKTVILTLVSTCAALALRSGPTFGRATAPPDAQAPARAQSAVLLNAQPISVAAPDHWVAFDATWRRSSPRSVVVGHYYQGDDGSTRTDSGPEGGPIMISSISMYRPPSTTNSCKVSGAVSP